MKHLRRLVVFVAAGVMLFASQRVSAQSPVSSALHHAESAPHVPVGVTALSTLGRASFARHHSAYGSELHLDQMVRLGSVTPFSLVLGTSVARMSSFDGRSWLIGGNSAIRLELNRARSHALELGLSYDFQRPIKEDVDQVSSRGLHSVSYLGPYTAYEWEFSHTFFVVGDAGVGFPIGSISPQPHLWCTLGLGANVLLF